MRVFKLLKYTQTEIGESLLVKISTAKQNNPTIENIVFVSEELNSRYFQHIICSQALLLTELTTLSWRLTTAGLQREPTTQEKMRLCEFTANFDEKFGTD